MYSQFMMHGQKNIKTGNVRTKLSLRLFCLTKVAVEKQLVLQILSLCL